MYQYIQRVSHFDDNFLSSAKQSVIKSFLANPKFDPMTLVEGVKDPESATILLKNIQYLQKKYLHTDDSVDDSHITSSFIDTLDSNQSKSLSLSLLKDHKKHDIDSLIALDHFMERNSDQSNDSVQSLVNHIKANPSLRYQSRVNNDLMRCFLENFVKKDDAKCTDIVMDPSQVNILMELLGNAGVSNNTYKPFINKFQENIRTMGVRQIQDFLSHMVTPGMNYKQFLEDANQRCFEVFNQNHVISSSVYRQTIGQIMANNLSMCFYNDSSYTQMISDEFCDRMTGRDLSTLLKEQIKNPLALIELSNLLIARSRLSQDD